MDGLDPFVTSELAALHASDRRGRTILIRFWPAQVLLIGCQIVLWAASFQRDMAMASCGGLPFQHTYRPRLLRGRMPRPARG